MSESFQLPDLALHPVRQCSVDGFKLGCKQGPVGQFDAVGIVAHVVQRCSAQSRFATIDLAVANLVSEPNDAIEKALRRQLHGAHARVQVRQLRDQCIGLVADVGWIGAKQLCFDAVESRCRIGPRVDGFIEFGDKPAGEHFRALPADPGVDPGLSRARKVLLAQPVTQIARPG